MAFTLIVSAGGRVCFSIEARLLLGGARLPSVGASTCEWASPFVGRARLLFGGARLLFGGACHLVDDDDDGPSLLAAARVYIFCGARLFAVRGASTFGIGRVGGVLFFVCCLVGRV